MDQHDERRGRELVDWIDAHLGVRCARCSLELCAHELLFATALGFRREPLCSRCAASETGASDLGTLRAHLRGHFERRACYRFAWKHADELEPRCALREVPAGGPPARAGTLRAELPHETWDAGELGCGELVLDLRLRMRALGAGEILELIARDPGAPEDLPAWCRMTGHELVDARPPRFLLRRRSD